VVISFSNKEIRSHTRRPSHQPLLCGDDAGEVKFAWLAVVVQPKDRKTGRCVANASQPGTDKRIGNAKDSSFPRIDLIQTRRGWCLTICAKLPSYQGVHHCENWGWTLLQLARVKDNHTPQEVRDASSRVLSPRSEFRGFRSVGRVAVETTRFPRTASIAGNRIAPAGSTDDCVANKGKQGKSLTTTEDMIISWTQDSTR